MWIKATGKARFEYFGDDEKTGSAYRGDYFTLGDVGRVDDDGFLFLTDRSANLIISGGVNIYPAEIDAVLLTHPAVADAGTIGVPDDEWGESVLAVVEPKPERRPRRRSPTSCSRSAASTWPAFKCPRAVDLVDHLPRDENGKLYKRRLRDEYRSSARALDIVLEDEARAGPVLVDPVVRVDDVAHAQRQAPAADAGIELVAQPLQQGDLLVEPRPPGRRQLVPVLLGGGAVVGEGLAAPRGSRRGSGPPAGRPG